jgi:hypothetical protein
MARGMTGAFARAADGLCPWQRSASANLRYCSQAEANEAAVAQSAAQSPSDDNSTAKDKAFLVKSKHWARWDAKLLSISISVM